MKKLALTIAIILCCTALRAQNFPFQDTNLNLEDRIEDLLSRLTLDEKLYNRTFLIACSF